MAAGLPRRRARKRCRRYYFEQWLPAAALLRRSPPCASEARSYGCAEPGDGRVCARRRCRERATAGHKHVFLWYDVKYGLKFWSRNALCERLVK